MSEFLGFQPTKRPDYYFVSYNSEDSVRVGELASRLSYANMPLWYDHGLEYGEKWESQIVDKIKNAQAVLLFFTKEILSKENSFVRKEYEIATKYLKKKVYVVMMDKVSSEDIPSDKLLWWIDIQEKQIIDITDMDSLKSIDKILEAVGILTHSEKMNQLIEKYRKLYDGGETKEAERFLSEYLHGQNLSGKVQLIANLVCGGINGNKFESWSTPLSEINDELMVEKLGKYPPYYMENFFQIDVKEHKFTILIREVAVPPSGAEIDAVEVLRGYERLYIATLLKNADNMKIYYDSYDDIIFITVEAWGVNKKGVYATFINIITIENPCGEAVCNLFRDVREK